MLYGASAESADVPRQLFDVSPGLRGRTQLQPQVMMPAVGPAIDPALYVGPQAVPAGLVYPGQYTSETHDGYSLATYFAAGATAAAAGYLLSRRPVAAMQGDAPLLPFATAEPEIEMHRPFAQLPQDRLAMLAVMPGEAPPASDAGEATSDPLADFVQAHGGKRVIRRILIANNGMAATKAIFSMRNWSQLELGCDALEFVAMASKDDLDANAEFIRLADSYVEVPAGKNSENYANVELICKIAKEQ